MNSKNYDKIILSILFLAIIFLPTLAQKLCPGAYILTQEKRYPASLPKLMLDASLLTFPSRFEAYFNDHFGFRNHLIKAYSILKVQYLNTSTSDRIVLGTNGWFFITQPHDTRPYTEEELSTIKNNLKNTSLVLNKNAIKYFVVVAPDSQSIYSEYFPPRNLTKKPWNRYDQLYNYIKSTSTFNVIIDVKEELLKNKKLALPPMGEKTSPSQELYFKQDWHWNHLGAYVAYREIIHHLQSYYPCLRPLPLSSMKITKRKSKKGLTKNLGLADFYQEQSYYLSLPTNTTNSLINAPDPACQNLTLVIVGDSMFQTFMSKILKNNFSRVHFIDREEPPLSRLNQILRKHPDIVIDEMLEYDVNEILLDPFYSSSGT